MEPQKPASGFLIDSDDEEWVNFLGSALMGSSTEKGEEKQGDAGAKTDGNPSSTSQSSRGAPAIGPATASNNQPSAPLNVHHDLSLLSSTMVLSGGSGCDSGGHASAPPGSCLPQRAKRERADGSEADPVGPRRVRRTLRTTNGGRQPPSSECLRYIAPESLEKSRNAASLQDVPFGSTSDSECVICMEAFCSSQPIVCLKECKHEFHRACIEAGLQHRWKCPVCRTIVGGRAQGSSPSGTMSITRSSIKCAGCDDASETFVINYSLPCGVQKSYHENPGARFGSTRRVAYVPDNREGQDLMVRLKYAFLHGLTFTVGTSMTTGMSNSIIWASIHHKTSCHGGVHGFPDAGFFINCNEELDALGVPKAEDCQL